MEIFENLLAPPISIIIIEEDLINDFVAEKKCTLALFHNSTEERSIPIFRHISSLFVCVCLQLSSEKKPNDCKYVTVVLILK